MRALAKELGLPKSTLQRHKNECAKLKFPTAEDRREPTQGTVALALMPSREDLAGRYETLADRIDGIVEQAQKSGSLAVAVQALNTLRQNLDSLGKLAGHTGAGTQVNVGVQLNISAADIGAEIAKHLAGSHAKIIEGVLNEAD